MTGDAVGPITQLLDAAAHGDPEAQNALWSTVYEEVHMLARAQLAHEGSSCSLQPTILISEAYLRLVGDGRVEWSSRRHFFGAAVKAMRRILIDEARSQARQKRGRGWTPAALPDELAAPASDPIRFLAISEAIEKLERNHPARAEVVMLRYLGGLSIDETAVALGVSPRSVDAAWRFARAWLHRELSKGDSTCPESGPTNEP